MQTEKISIQPLEVEVPAPAEAPDDDDGPFQNDQLDREPFAKNLTRIVQSIEGPGTLAIDAPWGAGKTTFIKMWGQHLKNEGFTVVRFNAWENDFTDTPFVSLSSELFAELDNKDEPQEIGELKEIAKSLFPWLKPLIQITVPAGEPVLNYMEKVLNGYEETKNSLEDFRTELQNIAQELYESEKNEDKRYPLIIIIDELDRCRPSYAIELLETVKHLFLVDRVLFVLAINRTELARAIQGIYGNNFNAKGYLDRFFDMSFRLPEPPEPGRLKFMQHLDNVTKLNKYLNKNSLYTPDDYIEFLQIFFVASSVSHRDIDKAFRHLALVFALLPRNHPVFLNATLFLIALKTLDSDLYYQFIQRKVSDIDIVTKLFQIPELRSLQETKRRVWFEGMLIVISLGFFENMKHPSSPLKEKYEKAIASGEENATLGKKVIEYVERHLPGLHRVGKDPYSSYSNKVVNQIEFISQTLL